MAIRSFLYSRLQDHKRALDGDLGPNTGGEGAYCPVPVVPQDVLEQAVEQIVRPAVLAIRELGIPYRGVLYAGIMLTESVRSARSSTAAWVILRRKAHPAS